MATLYDELDEILGMADRHNMPVVPEAARALLATNLSHDWDEALSAVATLTQAAHDFERATVRHARLDGLSWAEIGEGLGLSGPGARKRYGTNDLDELDQLDAMHDAKLRAIRSDTELRKLHDPRLQDPASDEARALRGETATSLIELTDQYSDERRRIVAEHEQPDARRRSR